MNLFSLMSSSNKIEIKTGAYCKSFHLIRVRVIIIVIITIIIIIIIIIIYNNVHGLHHSHISSLIYSGLQLID